MAEYQATVTVSPREGLLDPEGKAIGRALDRLGFDSAGDVRVGKNIELEVTAESEREAHKLVVEMCEQLLANPVTEDYEIELSEREAAA